MNKSKNTVFRFITLTLLLSFGNNAGAPGGDCTPDPNGRYLSVTLRPQKDTNWCWAACGQMVMEKLGTIVTQCEQVNDKLGRGDCCPASRPRACNCSGFPDFLKYNFTYDSTDHQALSWTNVKKQIDCEERPFCWAWKWKGQDAGHMVVISGYKIIDGVKTVKVINPYPRNEGDVYYIRYVDYVSGEIYSHWKDFYNIKKISSSDF